MNLDSTIVSLNALYDDFNQVPHSDVITKYSFPFPIAVFGTLRKIPHNCGNTKRMYQVSEPIYHSKAILPHIAPVGLHVDFVEGAAGIGEVYFYSPEVWDKAIIPIDNLEGFSPARKHFGSYLRTLIKVYLCPDDFANEEFNRGINFDSQYRVLPIKSWENFPSIPAWIYSNSSCNNEIQKKISPSPILWSC